METSRQNPLISIIVPVYRVAKYLGRCIESIQTQTYSDWELILVDDSSSSSSFPADESGMICDAYAAQDSRIRVIHHAKNQGVSVSRNDALQVMSGDYVVFIDGDDYVAPTMLEECLQELLDKQVDVVIFNVAIVEGGEIRPYPMNTSCMINRDTTYRALIEDKIPCYLCNKFFKRYLWEHIRLPANTFYEDLLIMPTVFQQVKTVSYLPKVLYYYNCNNENSITSNLSAKSKYGLFAAFLSRQPLAAAEGMHGFVQYARHRAIRSAVGCMGFHLARGELTGVQVKHLLAYLKKEEAAPDRPKIGLKYELLLYGALHRRWISKTYGYFMFVFEKIKQIAHIG